jgi:hypothetical protein
MPLLAASIDPHRVRDALLVTLAVAAGAVDALVWLALGKVFSAFMTGNVVLVAVGLSTHDSGLALRAAGDAAQWSGTRIERRRLAMVLGGPELVSHGR